MRLLLALLFCAAAALAHAAPTVSQGLAVHLHDIDLSAEPSTIAATGIAAVRRSLNWKDIETASGHYDWTYWDRFMPAMRKANLRPLLVLDYANPLYTPEQTPAAFARWAAALAERYRPYHPLYEIWNEPDNPAFWQPAPDAAAYATLAKATCAALRKADPSATILGPALAFPPLPGKPRSAAYLQALDASGALACLDGISLHPYQTFTPPEAVAAQLNSVRKPLSPASRAKPLYVTEFGFSSYQPTYAEQLLYNTRRIDTHTQAAYLIRQYLLQLAAGVPLSTVYIWRHAETNPNPFENHFGLLSRNGAPTPQHQALATLTAALGDYHIVKRRPSAPTLYILELANPHGQTALAVWTAAKAQKISLPLPAPATRVTLLGETSTLAPANGAVSLFITGDPQYLVPVR